MQTAVLVSFLVAILSLVHPRVRDGVRGAMAARPALLFLAPVTLTIVFCGAAASAGALSGRLVMLIGAYTLAPTLAAYAQGTSGRPSWLDLAIIGMLWLPLEFSAGAHLIPKAAQGFLHSAAYGVAIFMGLVLFLCFRGMPGMKYKRPVARDLLYGVAGFLVAAPVLVLAGRWLEFIPPVHWPKHPSVLAIGGQFLAIFAGTALPEEILFRSLIQNWCMQRYGFSTAMLLVSALIFGCAHLDNGPQPLPNWRYMILATIAGVVYGRVFQKSGSAFSSMTCHALVDATKHVFF